MAIKPPNGNHVIIEDVRASYDLKTNSIHITSKDPDFEEGFHLTLNGGRKAENALRKLMAKSGYIFPDAVDEIPTFLSPADKISGTAWNRIPLGKSSEKDELIWNTSLHPNALIAGHPAAGRGLLVSSIVNHCLSYKKNWEVHGIDLTATAFSTSEKARMTHFIEYLSDAVAHLENLTKEIEKRYALMDANPSTRFDEIRSASKHIMLFIENSSQLLTFHRYPGATDKASAELKAKALELVKGILENGSRVGVHVVISGQTHSSEVLDSGFTHALSAKFVIGRFSQMESTILLGNDDAYTKIKHGIKGRSLAKFDSEVIPFQTYSN